MRRLVHFLVPAVMTAFMLSVDYETEIQPIFNTSCISCHNTGSSSYGNHQLDLTSYSGLMLGGESGMVVTPGDSSTSILYDEINSGAMPPYGSGNDPLGYEIGLIAQWINEGALEEEETSDDGGGDAGDPANFDCQLDSDCMDGEFCAVECFSGPCGLDDSEAEGTVGQYCQPCDECESDQDAVSGSCDACGGTSDDGGDDGGSDEIPECLLDCEGIDTLIDIMDNQDYDGLCELYVSWGSCVDDCTEDDLDLDEFNDIQDQCEDCLSDPYFDCSDIDGGGDDGGDDGAPECMMDCAGVDTVDPEEDANAFCEWYIVAYDDTTCMDDCDDEYYGGVMAQIYFMCDMCLPLGNCDEMWNSDGCSDLDQSECEDNADCNWHEDDMMCDDLYCPDLDQSECEGNDNCEWDSDTMECDEVSSDGPPECWLDCEGVEVIYGDMTGTELCTWFVPVYEDGSCLGDCDQDEMFMSAMIYGICSECLVDDSCDEAFEDDDCSNLSQSDCDDEEACQWNDYDMMCEDMDCSTLLDEDSCEDNGVCEWNEYYMECQSSDEDGPPTCLEDCPGIWDVDPEEDATAFCEWYIPTYEDGTCMEDCGLDYNSELDEAYSICQECLADGNCDDAFDDDDCSDYDNEYDCDMYGCDWDSEYMECGDGGDGGTPECMMDCSGVDDVAEACSDENATEEECMAAYCSFIEANYSDEGVSCWDDCEDMYNPEMDGSLEGCGLIDLSNGDLAPTKYEISGAYPNPFNPYAAIEFSVPNYSNVKLYLIDANGHIIKDLEDSYYAPGVYTIGIDGSDYSSGIYFVRMVAGAHVSTQKLILLK